ncbi:MAG: ribonuclease T2 [Parasphingorhabdus sp.]|nr:ribonuclease T2 [Parasphingorhabdus sp.]
MNSLILNPSALHNGYWSYVAIVAIAFLAHPAHAQAYQCRAPKLLLPAPPDTPAPSEPRRAVPVASYLLTLSWSPEFCRTRKSDPRHAAQCGGDSGNFDFTLHGLWPEARGPGYPQWCAPTTPLSAAEVRRNFCMMPSPKLMAHEWAKHGTCMTRRPETYFRISRQLFDAIRYPAMDSLSRKPLTARQFRVAFAAENPGLRPEMIRLSVSKSGWLEEVRLCLAKNFRPQRCPAFMRRMDDEMPLKIWRGA